MENVLLFHIGFHKTGSTSILRFLYDNDTELRKYGWFYPDFSEMVKPRQIALNNGFYLRLPLFKKDRGKMWKIISENLKKYNVIIQISDYTDRVDYKKRKEDLTGLLEKHDIQYKVLRSDEWGDFGFPENPNDLMNEEQLTHFFNRCRAPFRGLYRQKVYFCHLETSAVRAGLFPDHKNDSFDLQGEYSDKKISFLEFDEGYCEKGYITFCAKCRGCSCVNDLTVVSAEQC